MANRYKFTDWKIRNCQSCVQCYTMPRARRLAREFLPLCKLTFLYPPVTGWHNATLSLITCVYKQFICFCLITKRWQFDYVTVKLRRIKRVSFEIIIPVSLAKIKLSKFSAPRQLIHQATATKTIVLVTCSQICQEMRTKWIPSLPSPAHFWEIVKNHNFL